MPIDLKHATQATGTDVGNGEIGKDEWNASHTLSMATGFLLGRTTAGAGAVEEITASTGLTLSAGALAVAKAFPAGDIVGTTDSQTLTNKTISGSSNTITNVSLTTGVAGTLPVANGGTGLAAGNSGGVLYYSASGTLASSAALAANSLVVGGGAGVAPSTIVTGTGVIGILGANIGSVGGIVFTGGPGVFDSVLSVGTSGILTRAAANQDGIEFIGRAGGTTSLKVTFTPTTLSANRTITLPDANINFTTGLAVAQGGTGATTAASARTNLGLGTAATMAGPSGSIVGTSDIQTLTNKTLSDPAIIGAIIEDVFTITDGASVDINPSNGTIQLWTLGANRTPSAASFIAGESVTLMILDGTAFTVTWTTIGVTWVGGAAPTLDTTKYTVIELWKVGTTMYGALVGYA